MTDKGHYHSYYMGAEPSKDLAVARYSQGNTNKQREGNRLGRCPKHLGTNAISVPAWYGTGTIINLVLFIRELSRPLSLGL